MDTNVLVSGMLTPFGICGEIVRMLTSSILTLCVDSRILFEYEDVLRRPRFKIENSMIDILIEYIENTSETHSTTPLYKSLPDSDDNQFLEVAVTANVDCLVTGNLRHFPPGSRCGIIVLSPREFLDSLKKYGTNE
ncbi:MAG: putative toxin-antitoxin system toxin component, PIN family [Spirochaetales bacterium]|nr:putative toxin-antitoxin system toxin component, PIN family [Spirochaetales bacterium]